MMEPVNESLNTPQQNTEPNPLEYAKKDPLVYPSTTKKIIKYTLIFAGVSIVLISAVIGGALIWKKLNAPTPILPLPPPATTTTTPMEDVPLFAYIKNGKAVWVSDINGDNKKAIVEIPITSKNVIIGLKWKTKENLSYSSCNIESVFCEIYTYDFATKAIKPEITKSGALATKFAFSPDLKYLGYIEESSSTTKLRFKLGTVDTTLKSFGNEKDINFNRSNVLFSNNSLYVLYSALRKDLPEGNNRGADTSAIKSYPIIYIYQVNGAQIDEIKGADYPYFIDENTIAYRKNKKLLYKTIGSEEESEITDMDGYNLAPSFDFNNVAYWKDDFTINNVVLILFDSKINIHRNVLRGFILPEWISKTKIAGVQTDSCLGDKCLLYEFKTASLVTVDVNSQEVLIIDQGKYFSEITFNKFYNAD